MSNIHLVMQGKGGVGKSLLAYYIALFVIFKKGKCLVFDTDPLNPTLARTSALDAKMLNLLAADNITIVKTAFDQIIEASIEASADVVIDVGASSFINMLEYSVRNGIFDLWHSMKHQCILHTIITGKDFADTCHWFGVVMEKTGRLSSTSSVVWLNPFFGPVERDGKGFEKTQVYQKNSLSIKAVLRMPAFVDEMMRPDFLRMMESGKTFDEAITDETFPIMSRHRINMMKQEVFSALEKTGIF
jgi:hypothetical protein